MWNKKKWSAGFLGILSLITAGSKVHAALEQEAPAPKAAPESFDLPLLQDAPVIAKVPMDPRLEHAVRKAIENADAEKLKDGMFIIGPNGELEYIGKKADFDRLRDEIIRLKMEKNHAGKLAPSCS